MGTRVAGEGRTVVITGASSGIGRASALMLDRAGFRVIAGVRKETDGEALKQQASSRLGWRILEVTDPAGLAAAADEIARELGTTGLWGLFCNAGVAMTAPVEQTSLVEMEQLFRVNVFGVVATVQAFLPLIRQGRGRIVITGSQGGKLGLPMLGAYCGSKHALEPIADALRLELHRFGVRVSLLEPGSIATSIWNKNLDQMDRLDRSLDPEARERYLIETRAAVRMAKLQARLAIAPEKAARRVLHAFTAARPKARYVIGLDARLNLLLNALVPDAIKDLGIRKGTEWFTRRR